MASPFFTHEESITLYPQSSNTIVRLEATSTLYRVQKEDETIATTPFPRIISQLSQKFNISRLFLSSASSSSTQYTNGHVAQDEYSMGPSGILLRVIFKDNNDDEQTFLSLIQALQANRLLLAPLDAISQSRLHRHVSKRHIQHEMVGMYVILPLQESAVALEGVREFTSGGVTSDVCPFQGLFSTLHAKSLSHVLLGDLDTISQKVRRSMWIDVQSTCHTNSGDGQNGGDCQTRLKRGIQYGVVMPTTTKTTEAIKLSKLVPFDSPIQECSVATSKTRLSIISSNNDDDAAPEPTKLVVDDWNMETIVDLSILTQMQQQVESTPEPQEVSANRILHRPRGVANDGRIATRIGSSLDCPATIQVVEVFPPFILPLWDTWTLVDSSITPRLSVESDGTIVVQYNVTLDPQTDLQISLDYQPSLLPFQQFPADPNRGMELPPSVFVVEATCLLSRRESVTLYSSPLLFMPPVPDMSMPFNVISLTCTLYAFVIGSLANFLIRKASSRVKTKLNPTKEKSKLQRIKDRIKSKFGRYFGKKNEVKEEEAAAANGDNGASENAVLSNDTGSRNVSETDATKGETVDS